MTITQQLLALLSAVLIGQFLFVVTAYLPRPDLPQARAHDVGRGLAWALPVAALVFIEQLVLSPRLGLDSNALSITMLVVFLTGVALFGVSLLLLRLRERPSSAKIVHHQA